MRDNDRNEDVMCWNCFTVDDVENDVEPITLKKVRIQQREKLKVYPFLASELSKPKAVALKQKLSSHYNISKKKSEKIIKNSKVQSELVADSQLEDKHVTSNPSIHQSSKSCQTDDDDEKHCKDEYLNNTIKIPLNPLVVNDDTITNDTIERNIPIKSCNDTNSAMIALSSSDNKETASENTQAKTVKSVSSVAPLKVERLTADNSKKNISQLRYTEHLVTQKEVASMDTKITTNVLIGNKTESLTATSEMSHEFERKKDENKIKFMFDKDSSDNFEKISNTNSESGYAGSSSSIKDLDNSDNISKIMQLRTKSVEDIKSEKHIDTIRHNENVHTSLSSINKGIIKTSKPLSLSMSSTITPTEKPVKALRWSTLSIPARKFSFRDELYISDTSTPHHATLPRRSNSPLPHDRDFDRERFPINRSGLQARSESMASVYSGAGEAMRGSVTVRGEVQFSLLYNYRLGALEVGVKRCRDLAPVDVKRNRSDPYVKVYLLPDKSKAGKRKTKVKKNTLSPVFEETLSFVQPLASLSARTLWLSAWHADMFGRNDFLGEVTLPLADVVFDDPAPQWYKLHERTEQFDEHQGSRGDLIIGLKFELQESGRGKGTLHVLVKEAKNLVATKPNGLTDVFCKSYLLPERGRLAKQKTGVARRTLSPRWEHTFAYRGLAPPQLAARALELSLWDRDRLASNDFMGAVRLSLGTGTYMGANVNWMDSTGKEVSLWQTMLERPNFWVEGSLPLRPQLNN